MNKIITLYFLCFFPLIAFSQIDPDSTDFISPIHHAIAISGSFGELRPNHFHSGIDLKSSKGVDGDVVLSAEEGYVSRIKIQASGYGNALYIDHPNGYTTVYAHLASFNTELDSFVRAKQYELESFPLDIYLGSEEINFAKGDTIGYMGNSGRSYGTHLHFEIRETVSEHVMNPFLFGIIPEDTKSPKLNNVLLYSLDKDFIPTKNKVLKVKKTKSGDLYLSNKVIEIDGWRMGIAIDTYDWMDGSWNKNGIYESKLYINDSLIFKVQFDKFSFEQSRYANACIDYERKQTKGGNRVMKLYTDPGNKLQIYNRNILSGVIPLFADNSQRVKIESLDFHGNISEVNFLVKRKAEISPMESKVFNYYFHYDSVNTVNSGNVYFSLPIGTLYRNSLFEFTQDGQNFSIGNKAIPCHRYYNIEFDLSSDVTNIDSKLCLLYKVGNTYKSFGGSIEGGIFKSRVNRFGDFKIGLDTIPPSISKVSKNSNYKRGDYIDFTVKDNFEVLGSAKDLNIKTYIDSEWVLHIFDEKNHKIRIPVQPVLLEGKHELLVVVIDDKGNMQKLSSQFFLK